MMYFKSKKDSRCNSTVFYISQHPINFNCITLSFKTIIIHPKNKRVEYSLLLLNLKFRQTINQINRLNRYIDDS